MISEPVSVVIGSVALLVGVGYCSWMIVDGIRCFMKKRRRARGGEVPRDYSTNPPDHLDYRYIAHLEADLQVGAYDPLNVLERIRDEGHVVTAYGKTFRDVGGLRADRIQANTITADRIRAVKPISKTIVNEITGETETIKSWGA